MSEDWRNGPGGSRPSGRRLSRWLSGRRSWLAAGGGAGSILLAASLVAFVDSPSGHSVTDGDAGVELADGNAASPDSPGGATGDAKTKDPSDPGEADGATTTTAPSAGSEDGIADAGAADPDDPSSPAGDEATDGSEADPGTGAAAPTTAPTTTVPPADDVSTAPVGSGGGKDGTNQVRDESQAPAITGFTATRVTGSCSDARQVMTKFEWSSTNGTSASVGQQGGASIGVDTTSHLLTCAVRRSSWVLTVSGPGGTTSAVTSAPA